MAVTGLQTNLNVASALNVMRGTQMASQASAERLSTGERINHAADSPSGLALSINLKRGVRGIEGAIKNLQDAISLIHTADNAVGEINQMQLRARDLCVRGANAATMTYEDLETIFNQIQLLRNDMWAVAQKTAYNEKSLLTGKLQDSSISVPMPDGNNLTFDISIPEFTSQFSGAFPPPPIPFQIAYPPTTEVSTIAANFAKLIDWFDERIGNILNVRAGLGMAENQMKSTLNDLMSQRLGLVSAKSTLTDTRFEEEFVSLTQANALHEISAKAFDHALNSPYLNLQFLENLPYKNNG